MLGEHSTWGSGPGTGCSTATPGTCPGVERFSISSSPGGGPVVPRRARRSPCSCGAPTRSTGGSSASTSSRAAPSTRRTWPRRASWPSSTRRPAIGCSAAVPRWTRCSRPTASASGSSAWCATCRRLRQIPYADVWVPLTTAKTDAYKNDLMGPFMGIALLQKGASSERLNEEFLARLRRAELPDPKNYSKLIARFETPFENLATELFGQRGEEEAHVGAPVGGPRRRRPAVHAAADREPREPERQPHHGAGVGDRRAQGLRRLVSHAGRTVRRRERRAVADRRRGGVRAVRGRPARAHGERPRSPTRSSASTFASSSTGSRSPCSSASSRGSTPPGGCRG